MTLRSSISKEAKAFVKRRSSVQSRLAAPLLQRDNADGGPAESAQFDLPNGVAGTEAVHCRRVIRSAIARWWAEGNAVRVTPPRPDPNDDILDPLRKGCLE